ncbi:ABC transporter ATP-binding protein [Rhizobium beringeri]
MTPSTFSTGVDIDVMPGQITCILGVNRAGKSTLIRSILRLTPPRTGTVTFNGNKLDGLKTHEIARLGIGCIPEGRRIFARMTVEDNLQVGAYNERSSAKIRTRLERVFQIFPRLKEREKQIAGTLSGGEQAMVSIGRGLMTDPRMLIIDEPSLGLSPLFVQENFNVIRDIAKAGVTVLLVEQNVNQTPRHCRLWICPASRPCHRQRVSRIPEVKSRGSARLLRWLKRQAAKKHAATI